MTVALGINQLQNADNTVFLVPKWNGKGCKRSLWNLQGQLSRLRL